MSNTFSHNDTLLSMEYFDAASGVPQDSTACHRDTMSILRSEVGGAARPHQTEGPGAGNSRCV